ncbi:hypothetical protein V8G54_013248 [Vigna mungo]|uniref:Uncharacterized protein n=1 Tax=Vigna mungo TaxID=3915 RepID=A0AAQ3NVS2_VIGMU
MVFHCSLVRIYIVPLKWFFAFFSFSLCLGATAASSNPSFLFPHQSIVREISTSFLERDSGKQGRNYLDKARAPRGAWSSFELGKGSNLAICMDSYCLHFPYRFEVCCYAHVLVYLCSECVSS